MLESDCLRNFGYSTLNVWQTVFCQEMNKVSLLLEGVEGRVNGIDSK